MPKAVTLQDLADRLGISVATVSRALNDHPKVSATTRRRVAAAARTLRYQPNLVARALRNDRTMLVGLVVPDVRSAFFAEAATVLQSVLEEHGYRVILCISHEDPNIERGYLLSLLELRVDGIVHVPCTADGAAFIRDVDSSVPVVELYRHTGGSIFDAVAADDRDGITQLMRHLIGLGHRRVAMIVGPESLTTSRERVAGFEEAAAELDQPIVQYGEYSQKWGYDSVRRLVSEPSRPTAIIAASNQLVSGALRALIDSGLDVPSDMSVVGFDDPEWYSLCRPAITTYQPPLYQMGVVAAQLLIRRMSAPAGSSDQHPSTLARLLGKLVVRESCSRAPAATPAK